MIADQHEKRSWEITAEITDREFRLALRHFWMRAYRSRHLTIIAGLLAALILHRLIGDASVTPEAMYVAFAILLVSSILGYVRYVRTQLSERKEQEEHTVNYRFSDEAVSISFHLGTSELNWRAFRKLWKFPEHWLLFVNKTQFLILPTAVMDPDLRAFIDRHIQFGAGLPKCNKCGYDLRGQEDARCPECGREFSRDILRMLR